MSSATPTAPSRVHSYRPPVGLPTRERRGWQGWIVSVVAHAVILLCILLPLFHAADLGHAEGAGGAGPAGGGGGGSQGASADRGERIHFVAIPAPPPAAVAAPVTPPVVPPPPVKPPVTPPVVAPAPTPAPAQVAAPTTPSAGAGVGTGSGTNAGAGAGPGSGGGVGSGEGTGRGSSVGPGTGGGNAKNYPPTPKQFFLPPLPAPAALRGFHMTAWFDVDSTGKATLLRFTPSPDGGYNKQLKATLLAMKFRPAVRPDGVPIRDTVDVQFDFSQ